VCILAGNAEAEQRQLFITGPINASPSSLVCGHTCNQTLQLITVTRLSTMNYKHWKRFNYFPHRRGHVTAQ
jgi:hypothetical protein